jgi:predicted DsbA family dithiol-disulfide isomerase
MADIMRIDIISDTICPWCFVGKRQLEAALPLLAADGLTFSVGWRPYQLNPDMPVEGVPRTAYRTAKFGSLERSRELDAGVAQAGAAVGLVFRHDLMQRTPNTVASHRLIRAAEPAGLQDQAVERLFRAYFQEGRDIGDAAILADIAEEIGLGRDALASDDGRAEVLAEDAAARNAGLNGVPSILLQGYFLFSGAMPADAMASQLRRAHAVLSARAA